MSAAAVLAVCSDKGHNFSKPVKLSITLIEGLGVAGDAHLGKTVQHLYDKRRNPEVPNLRQVHLMHSELFDELSAQGMDVRAGDMGENIVTQGLDLLALPTGAELSFKSGARIGVTGLRNPCAKLNVLHAGLLKAVLYKTEDGRRLSKTGVMGVVLSGGDIVAGDEITVSLPEGKHIPLSPV